MNTFTIEGFKHITAEGIVEFWQFLGTKGTVDLVFDMQPRTKVNALMQSANFDMDAHIKTNFPTDQYDDVSTELFDELLETITTLEYCFVYDVYSIDFKGRSIHNLDAIPTSDTWSPNVYLPVTCMETFQNMDEVAGFCMDNFSAENDIGEITVQVNAYIDADDSSDGQEPQSFEYRITGAGDCNILTEIVDTFIEWGYEVTFIRTK